MVLRKLFGGSKKDEGTTPSSQQKVPSHTDEAPAAAAGPRNEAPQQDGNEPPSAIHLEQAMMENARQDTPESRTKVYQELLFSDLLLALADPAEGETKQDADPNNLSVAILSNPTGTRFAAAFTSSAAARRWRPEGGQFVSVRGQDIYKLLEPSPADVIVINPGSAPFIVLPKVEYRQLALGVVPQSPHSPVQVAAGGEGQQEGQQGEGNGQMQVAFPPDVFDDAQKEHARKVMHGNPNIEAAVLGAILPPNAGNENWVRTVFLRVKNIEESNDAMQAFCLQVRKEIAENQSIFKDIGFEVGVMPDPNFWIHMHQNQIILFDKNPPPMDPGAGA